MYFPRKKSSVRFFTLKLNFNWGKAISESLSLSSTFFFLDTDDLSFSVSNKTCLNFNFLQTKNFNQQTIFIRNFLKTILFFEMKYSNRFKNAIKFCSTYRILSFSFSFQFFIYRFFFYSQWIDQQIIKDLIFLSP